MTEFKLCSNDDLCTLLHYFSIFTPLCHIRLKKVHWRLKNLDKVKMWVWKMPHMSAAVGFSFQSQSQSHQDTDLRIFLSVIMGSGLKPILHVKHQMWKRRSSHITGLSRVSWRQQIITHNYNKNTVKNKLSAMSTPGTSVLYFAKFCYIYLRSHRASSVKVNDPYYCSGLGKVRVGEAKIASKVQVRFGLFII